MMGRLPPERGGYSAYEFQLAEKCHLPHPRLLAQMISPGELAERYGFDEYQDSMRRAAEKRASWRK